MITLETTVQRDREIISAEAGSDIVMVSIANGHYYGVSSVARDIWEMIDEPMKVSAMVDRLAAEYDIDRATCESETLGFLNHLLAEKLLRVDAT